MNSKRPEKVHYIPPGRRPPRKLLSVVQGVSAPPPPPPLVAPPPPPAPLGPIFINASPSPATRGTPVTSHAAPVLQSSAHARFEPSTSPPLRTITVTTIDNNNNITTNGMRPPHHSSHGRLPGQRRENYDSGTGPAVTHHRLEVREHRPSEAFYRSERVESSPRLVPAKYGHTGTHLPRNRSYEDRYNEAPPPFRSKAIPPPPGWMESVGKQGRAPSPMMVQPVRILRNPDRERERAREGRGEFSDEHVGRPLGVRGGLDDKPRPAYAAAPAPGGKAQFLGDNIHKLTPLTTLEERCGKYIDTLHPERPDPPAQDEPYEYPFTQPCDPSTLPPVKNGRNFPVINERPEWMPDNIRIPIDGEHNYFSPAMKVQPEKRRRHRHRSRRDYAEDSSLAAEDCARRLYRLQT